LPGVILPLALYGTPSSALRRGNFCISMLLVAQTADSLPLTPHS